MNKKKILIIVLSAIAAALALSYAVTASFFSLRFFPGTVIGGIDCSLMTLFEAESAVSDKARIESIKLIGRDSEMTMDLSDANALRLYPDPREILLKQEYYAWPLHLGDESVYGRDYTVSFDEDGLYRSISDFLSAASADALSPQAAYIDYDETGDMYVIVPDTEGTLINRAALRKALEKALRADEESLDLEEAGAYYVAGIRAGDETLAQEAAFLNAVNLRSINIDMSANCIETIEGRKILDFLNDERVPDESKVREYVSYLSQTYNTYDTGTKRVFTTHDSSARRLTAYYGWQLNEERTVRTLLGALEEVIAEAGGEDVSEGSAGVIDLSASWTRTAASHSAPDYGSTYIEVDMGSQEVYVYVNGETVIETPCVTGLYRDEKRRTPAGIWYIKSKQTAKTLTGYNPDGSIDYESFVNYWMPFNGGIGLHDATWRGTFGGSIYMTNGSHGCINLPIAAARQLYDLCYVGMPVICYY